MIYDIISIMVVIKCTMMMIIMIIKFVLCMIDVFVGSIKSLIVVTAVAPGRGRSVTWNLSDLVLVVG